MQTVLPLVGYRNLHIETERITLAQSDMGITLDGIGKGYIVDAGIARLQTQGFNNVLVEAGGDLFAAGQKTPQQAWLIGIQSPRAMSNKLVAQLRVSGQAVASSGDYIQTFTPNYAHHHILDPRSGMSPSELASVTVVAPSLILADALATALMVTGRAGLALVEQWSSCAAYVIDKQLITDHTDNFPF